jgi:Protein of unknown function (DUF3800)
MLVFIDESGDPGFKLARGSTPVFVAALVAFKESAEAKACQAAIETLAVRLRIGGEFKFSGSRPEVRDAFFKAILKFHFCVRAIVVRKERIYSAHLRTDKEAFYSFFVKTMLRFDDGLLSDATVVIDGSGDREFRRELGTYLRRHLGPGRLKRVRFSNSAGDRGIQLADMCAGAIARSYRDDRSDASQWRDMLRPKIENVWPFR